MKVVSFVKKNTKKFVIIDRFFVPGGLVFGTCVKRGNLENTHDFGTQNRFFQSESNSFPNSNFTIFRAKYR